MLPETDFHKRRNTMFALVEGLYYTSENAARENFPENYFCLSNKIFPLNRGRNIFNEEQDYLRRNSAVIRQKVEEIKSDLKDNKLFDGKILELDLLRDVNFFLTNICKPDNPNLNVGRYEDRIITILPEGEDILKGISLLKDILPKSYAVINGRLYPLRELEALSFIRLNGKNYTLESSKMTVDEVENTFQGQLTQELIARLMKNSERFKEISDEVLNLSNKNALIAKDLGITRYAHCYECGNMGFDLQTRSVYVLIEPHYNHTTGKSYSEGKSAATLSLNKGVLASTGVFAERPSRDASFVISTTHHCLGDLRLNGTTLEDKILYLREFANTVAMKGGFYQQEDSSS